MSNEPKYYFDEKAADAAIRFIETQIYHIEGAKQGELVKLEEWQQTIIRDIFGWKRTKDKTRKYRKAYIQVGRGNGKSTLIGAICNLVMFLDREPAAQIYYAAYNKEQATQVGYRIVSEQIMANPRLAEKVRIYSGTKTIEYRPSIDGIATGLSYFKTMSKDSRGQHGLNAHLVIVDEYHTHATTEVIDTLATSQLKRTQPLIFIITTSGFDTNSPCYKEYEYAKGIIEGRIEDESYYAAVWEASDEDDIFDEETWKKANPNYGVSIHYDYFQQQCQRILNEPSYENVFRVLHLSQWVNTEARWISDTDWMQHDQEFSKEMLKGKDCFVAFDLSSTRDMTALTAIIPHNGKYYSINKYYLPEKTYKGSADYANDSFLDWVANENVTLTTGAIVDYEVVYQDILKLDEMFSIVNINYDPYNANLLAAKLEKEGYNCQKFRQGFITMNYPTKQMEMKVIEGKFIHGNDPVLRWMAGNANVTYDPAGNVKVIKDSKKPHRKVDGIITNIMALGAALQAEFEEKTNSYLEENGGELYVL